MQTRVDWLTVTHSVEMLDDLRSYLTTFFGDESTTSGVRSYRSCYSYDDRAYLRFSLPEGDKAGRPDISLDLPGRAVGALPYEDLQALLETLLHAFDGRPSRIDVAVDDAEWRITPADLWSLRGRAVGLKASQRYENDTDGGVTAYFGRRGKSGSLAFLRVYDKNAESQGEINAVRWEVSFAKEKAVQAAELLTGYVPDLGCFQAVTSDEFSRRCHGLVFGVVDFREDGRRLPWYHQLIDGAARVKLAHVRREQERTVEACEKTLYRYGAAMAAVRMYYEQRGRQSEFHQLIERIANDGEARMDPRLRKTIDQNYKAYKMQLDLAAENERKAADAQRGIFTDPDKIPF